MKAAVLTGYDKNGRDLELLELPTPQPAPGEVLVKIRTAGVNPLDNMIVRGEVKLVVPYRFPLVMGNELVGTVEKLGGDTSRFAVGDRVYGRMPLSKIGAFAEYAAVDETALAKVPDYLSDEEAACVPLTALTALQSLELMGARAGDSIFISGGYTIPVCNPCWKHTCGEIRLNRRNWYHERSSKGNRNHCGGAWRDPEMQ